MEDVMKLVEDLMMEYAELVGAPFPMSWGGTAYENEPLLAQEWENEHPAYVQAAKLLNG